MQMIDVIPQPESAMNVIRDYWNIALRRKWLVASAVALCLGAAWLYCMVSPKLYRSETLILVEEQKIPESYVQGVVEHNLEQRLFVIQKEILSRPLLTEIVNEFQLYPAEIKKDGIDSAVNQLANAIRVELLANPPRGSSMRAALDAFTISVIHEDPGTAMLVASRIASKFIEQNVKSREEIAEGTSQFLDSEVLSAQRE